MKFLKNTIYNEEEEEDSGWKKVIPSPIGFVKHLSNRGDSSQKSACLNENIVGKAIEGLLRERQEILQNERISCRLKHKLLESNRKSLVILTGGTIKKNR